MRDRETREGREYEQRVIEIARVTRVVKGGKRMRFRACVVVGDEKGKVGMGVEKGPDVAVAVNKATAQAKKHFFTVPITEGTIPHGVRIRLNAAEILLKPAPKGTGVIAGGALRPVLEVIGITNVVAKMLGSKSKVNNVKALLEALRTLKPPKKRAKNAPAKKNGVQNGAEKDGKEKVGKETTA